MRLEEHKRITYKETLSLVIGRFNEIEFQLTAVLIRALGLPKQKESFAYKVLFNNAIIPFAQKVKILLNLRSEMGWPKINPNCFHRLAHIRNQFAHGLPKEHIRVNVNTEKNSVKIDMTIMLESIDGSGKLTPTSAEEAFNEFKKYGTEVSQYLIKINRTTVEKNESSDVKKQSG